MSFGLGKERELLGAVMLGLGLLAQPLKGRVEGRPTNPEAGLPLTHGSTP
jgi:hypothetical protein